VVLDTPKDFKIIVAELLTLQISHFGSKFPLILIYFQINKFYWMN